MPTLKLTIALAATLGLSACATAPAHKLAVDVIPQAYAQSSGIDTANAADLEWTSVVRDPRLRGLIEQALSQSRDLRTALLDAQAAKAQLRVQNASFFPQVQGDIQHARSRAFAGAMPGAPVANETFSNSQASANLSLTAFEIDLFGRLRAQSQSAMASYLAAEEGARAARIILIGAVSEAYLAQRAAAEGEALTQATLADWRTQLDLARRLKTAGQSSALDLAQAEGQVRSAEAQLEAASRAKAVAANALALVVGAQPAADLPPPMALADKPVVTELAAGLPSALLQRRPDLRQAEQRLVGARADVRAARAAFFPSLTLTAALGRSSPQLGDLFSDGGRTWAFTPQLTAPIFQGGRLKGQYDLAKIRGDGAVAAYDKAVQTAFREVSDGLAGRATFGAQIVAQQAAVESARQGQRLARLRYESGLDGRLELLVAQRGLYEAQLALVQLRQQEAASAVNLYRALGGGAPPAP